MQPSDDFTETIPLDRLAETRVSEAPVRPGSFWDETFAPTVDAGGLLGMLNRSSTADPKGRS